MKNAVYPTFVIIILFALMAITGCVALKIPNQEVEPSTGSFYTSEKPQYQDSSCFQFSNIESKILLPDKPQFRIYRVTANVKNTCMENFDHVCIQAIFYDKDNMIVITKNYEIAPFQHGLTKGVAFNIGPGTGLNDPVRQEFTVKIVDPGVGYLYCM